jgi:hypothetical protein
MDFGLFKSDKLPVLLIGRMGGQVSRKRHKRKDGHPVSVESMARSIIG